jgi:hypothetical protein
METDMLRKLLAFVQNESGATAIEYGLIAAGIAVAINRRERPWHEIECQVHVDLVATEVGRTFRRRKVPPAG